MNYCIVFAYITMLANFESTTAFQDKPNKALRSDLMGEWIYHYSWIDGKKDTVDFNTICPTFRMIFSAGNDSKDLVHMPKVVKDLRKNNVLKDLRCQTYQYDEKPIDVSFPVADRILSGSIEISNYGNKYKSDFFIDKISIDSLFIHDNKVYKIEGKQYFPVQHVYVKKKKQM